MKAGLFRVRQMELGGKMKAIVNGTFNSKWKSQAIPGIYECHQNETELGPILFYYFLN